MYEIEQDSMVTCQDSWNGRLKLQPGFLQVTVVLKSITASRIERQYHADTRVHALMYMVKDAYKARNYDRDVLRLPDLLQYAAYEPSPHLVRARFSLLIACPFDTPFEVPFIVLIGTAETEFGVDGSVGFARISCYKRY